MKKENVKMKNEIREVREQLNNCILKNGISDEPTLMDINNRLDNLILQWMRSNK